MPDTWEEIKDQLQHGQSFFWPMYLETMRQFVSGMVGGLEGEELEELKAALKCSSPVALERKLMQRLVGRGKKEKIRYARFDFEFFCYRLRDFAVYGQVIERTGVYKCYAHVFSGAAPTGEYGNVECSRPRWTPENRPSIDT